MSPFVPLGDQAQWRLLYAVLQRANAGDIVTYTALGQAINADPTSERQRIQLAIRRAAREYENVDKHALVAVENVGYRVVEATEHLGLARRQQKRAGKALQRGHSKVVNVDLNALDAESRKAFEVVARAFAAQISFNRRLDSRQKRLEDVVDAVTTRADRTDAEVQELRERLARLERPATG